MSIILPPVVELLEIGDHANPDAKCFHVRVKVGEADELARRLALHIAFELMAPSDAAFESWNCRFEGGPEHDAATKAEIEAYVMADFEPAEKDKAQTRLLGAIVEHLWTALASSLDGFWGRPFHVEHDHFSVIDHGPDGLSLYDSDTPDLRFRLWESKRHTGKGSVTTVMTGAAEQMKGGAAQYLARISKPLQSHDDARVQQLSGEIVRLWTIRNDRAAVGVSVGRSTNDHVPARPLQGLVKTFEFAGNGRCEGVIIEISDLVKFSEGVRTHILKGIE
ncbi:hypothetical protein [Rhodococcus qingshengii]|uniref:hypothetical protein n=1 Tax=Rhodococcus qingshengii TaxID=334542 RepID=UPI001C8C8295|nr:hypothetical protein [Rhodococcus qingshengii]MBX9151986.1 hypothetical protein [Rhodococcus qingshengii]